MRKVELVDEQEMNLLGLILRDILERNLERPVSARWSKGLNSTVHVRAGEMVVTIRFSNGTILIERGEQGRANASVAGSLAAFMDLATMTSMARPLLTGDVSIGGNPLVLLRIFPLLLV